MLYNQTRAATIEAKSETVSLYRVNGDTFKAVLNNQANDDPQLLEKIDQAINQGWFLPLSLTLSVLVVTSSLASLTKKNGGILHYIVAGTKSLYGGDIIRTYKSPRRWLWRRWRGTVFQHNWRTVSGNMFISLLFICFSRSIVTTLDHSHPWIQRFVYLRK